MKGKISIRREIVDRLMALVREKAREESCGLLAGSNGAITHEFAARNAADHPETAYEIPPEELFRLMREMRAAGLDFLGIYHSHPQGENYPSPRDLESAYYPNVAYFIVSPRKDAAQTIRAFAIRDGRATELAVHTI